MPRLQCVLLSNLYSFLLFILPQKVPNLVDPWWRFGMLLFWVLLYNDSHTLQLVGLNVAVQEPVARIICLKYDDGNMPKNYYLLLFIFVSKLEQITYLWGYFNGLKVCKVFHTQEESQNTCKRSPSSSAATTYTPRNQFLNRDWKRIESILYHTYWYEYLRHKLVSILNLRS